MRTRIMPDWFPLLPFAVSFALGVWAFPRQPERVPVHWGADGQPDRWGSPAEGLFATPGTLLFVSLLILAASRAQPAATHLLRRVIFGLGLLALFSTAAQAFGGDSFRVTMVALGSLFLLMGPALGQTPPSSLSGPRLSPTTLRRLGTAWTLFGVVLILVSLLAPVPGLITATLVLGLIGVVLLLFLGVRRDRLRFEG